MTGTRAEKRAVYAAGRVQGITLVTFPAASTIFTSPSAYDLSAAQYGVMFVPQVVMAIIASLAGARLSGPLGLAAFGVGPLRSAGISLPAIYSVSAAVAVVLGILSVAVAHRRPSPASWDPRPARAGQF